MQDRRLGAGGWLAVLFGLQILVPVQADAQPWADKQVADPGGVGGTFSSIALEGAKVHASYYDAGEGTLRYVRLFSAETVDSGNVGAFSSLALESPDVPHISYYDGSLRDLKYATKVGGVWQRQTVDSAGFVGLYTSLALKPGHPAPIPCISYFDMSNADLKYACKEGPLGTWISEVVDAAGEVGAYTSLAIDGAGHAHISYQDLANGDLKYVTNSSGTWRAEVVDDVGNVGQYTSLELDAAGQVHIAYYDVTNRHLKYAHQVGRGWDVATVDFADGTGQFASLGIGGAGEPRIAYYDSVLGDLKYAWLNAGSWTITTLVDQGNVGAHAALAVKGDAVVVLYFDATYGSLRAAYYDPGIGPAYTNLHDAFGSAGRSSSSARDSLGRVHVAHLVTRTGSHAWELRYALGTSTSWTYSVIDAAGADEPSVSLAVDGSDVPHVAYSRDGEMWYARKVSPTSWSREKVPTGPDAQMPSLRIQSGFARIAYEEGGQLRYASRSATGWIIEKLGPGTSASLVIGPGGWPHISLYRFGQLRYAHKIPTGGPCNWPSGCWINELVDEDSDNGGTTSLALDAAGIPHISYHRTFPGDDSVNVEYATKPGASWSLQTVDDASFAPNVALTQSVIALDPTGTPHIAYFKRAGNPSALRYAHKLPAGGFDLETVDASFPVDLLGMDWPEVGRHPSLTMTAAGTPCITYQEDMNGPVLKSACR